MYHAGTLSHDVVRCLISNFHFSEASLPVINVAVYGKAKDGRIDVLSSTKVLSFVRRLSVSGVCQKNIMIAKNFGV